VKKPVLQKDPYNIVITGVGGKGNVMASRGPVQHLVKNGFTVTIEKPSGCAQRCVSVIEPYPRLRSDGLEPPNSEGNGRSDRRHRPLDAGTCRLRRSQRQGPGKYATDLPRGGDSPARLTTRSPRRSEEKVAALSRGRASRCDGRGGCPGESHLETLS